MESALLRRCVSIGGLIVVALLLLVLAPLWLVGGVIIDLIRGKLRLPIVRLLTFGTCWCWLELAGVAMAGALWISGQSHRRSAHYAIQRWWSSRLVGALRVTCSLRVEIEGLDTLGARPIVALCRHASIADALVVGWVLSAQAHRKPRFVLKKELSFDPCLDVVGRRVPNYFVDRRAVNTQTEINGIAEMAHGMTDGDVAIIFPEGTRTNPKKQAQVLQKLRDRDPQRGALLAGLKYLLPPKFAGAAALIAAVPNADVITVSHVGFDGLNNFRGMLSQVAAKQSAARVVITRHARENIPSGAEFVAWLDAQWLEMDRKLSEVMLLANRGEI